MLIGAAVCIGTGCLTDSGRIATRTLADCNNNGGSGVAGRVRWPIPIRRSWPRLEEDGDGVVARGPRASERTTRLCHDTRQVRSVVVD